MLKGLIGGEVAQGGPFFVELDLTCRCNMSCLGCQYHSSKTRGLSPGGSQITALPLSLALRIADELSTIGTKEVIITGEGEPFLHPQLFDVLAGLKQAGLRVHLFTNGTLITPARAASLLESVPDILKVSLWASSEEEYLQCYPNAKPEYFQRTLEGIREITRQKAVGRNGSPKVILTGPINRFNHRTLDRKINLAHELGCDGVAFSPFKHWRGEFSAAALSEQEIETLSGDLVQAKHLCASLSLEHNLDDLLLQYRLGEEAWSKMPCYAAWYQTRIRYDGTVMPCCRCYLPLGNLNEQSFAEIWNSEKYRVFRQKSGMKDGLTSFQNVCECDWCLMAKNNYQVHRFSHWITRIFGRVASSAGNNSQI